MKRKSCTWYKNNENEEKGHWMKHTENNEIKAKERGYESSKKIVLEKNKRQENYGNMI